MTVPASIRAGDSWSWELVLPEYPAASWTLTYFFTNADGQFSIAASGSGSTHTLTQAAAATAARAAGNYKWFARVSDGTDAYTLDEGLVEILPALGTVIDPRGWARKALDSLQAQMSTGVPFDQASVSINGRQKSFKSNAEMIQMLDYLKAQAALEETADRHGLGRDIRVRFSRV